MCASAPESDLNGHCKPRECREKAVFRSRATSSIDVAEVAQSPLELLALVVAEDLGGMVGEHARPVALDRTPVPELVRKDLLERAAVHVLGQRQAELVEQRWRDVEQSRALDRR